MNQTVVFLYTMKIIIGCWSSIFGGCLFGRQKVGSIEITGSII